MNAHRLLTQLESQVDAFEAARCVDGTTKLADFVPPLTDPLFNEIALELIRVDLEYSWRDGRNRTVEDYQHDFPELLDSPERLGDLAFEEYRLRWQHGETVDRRVFANRFGVDSDTWPILPDASPVVGDNKPFAKEGESFAPEIFAPEIPGFRIREQLGSGAVGQVYLARQTDLAERLVVLKCSQGHWHESEHIARLQHTNIVPIFSVHRAANLQAICMPYFGRTTLADVIRRRADTTGKITATGEPSKQSDVPFPSDRSNGRISGELEPANNPHDEKTCLQTIGKLAEGLEHAHERGIWHQDVKPANILMADHGQPMLLDFNLATDVTASESMSAGGTLAYMSPEQIRGLTGRSPIGPWSDVYSLGVVLYELLTGEVPFSSRAVHLSDDWSNCLQERKAPPSARDTKPTVSRAASAIVDRCLAPDLHNRYQSASQLVEDIRRHCSDLPLRHAPNRSWSERTAKWLRRHPRTTSASSIATLAIACIAAVTLIAFWQKGELARIQGTRQVETLAATVELARAPLTVPGTSAELVQEARSNLENALDAMDAAPDLWRDWPKRTYLRPDERRRSDATFGRVCYLLANAVIPGEKGALNAMQLNALAEDAFSTTQVPQAVLQQKRRIEGLPIGPTKRSARDREVAPLDAMMLAGESLRNGNYLNAVEWLTRAEQDMPADFNVKLLLGNCHYALGDSSQAILDFTAAASLWPESQLPLFYRGLARLENGEPAAAERDFSSAIKIHPTLSEAFLNRAIARMKQGEYQRALEDLDLVVKRGHPPVRTFFLRAKVRQKLGDHAGSQADRTAGLTLEPRDEDGYIARALARLPEDAIHCKQELDQVALRNPTASRALQNLAHVCSEYLAAPEEAIEYLNRMLAIRKSDVTAIAGRGVLHARMGNVEESLADAKRAEEYLLDATQRYQLACLYALNVSADATSEQKSLKNLSQAIRAEPQWLTIAPSDPDLGNLHATPDFQRLIDAGRTIDRAARGDNLGRKQ